jgi:CubicO group peptidase (beta-lactamase class C family)
MRANMKKLFLAFILLAASSLLAQLPPTSPEAAGFDPVRLEVLHSTVQRFVDEGKHAGIVTLLARDGKIVDFHSYGYRDLERRLPMEHDTICRVYSMSKIITCVATLMLFEEGRFNLDDPVANYLPELKEMKVWTGGTLEGKRILSRKTLELMAANHLVTLPNNQAASRQKGFGLGVEVTTDLGQLSMPSSVGQFGWYGAATTYCQIDPKEKLVAVALVQPFPFNEHNFFARSQTGYYQALK